MTPGQLDVCSERLDEELLDDWREIEALLIETFGPISHYAHPEDPHPDFPRWAACGAPLLGLPADDLPHVLCWECEAAMQAKDWMPLPG